MLLFRALGLVVGDALQERVHRVLDVLAALLLLFALVAVLARRPGDVGPQGFEPVAQAQGRDAVFLVVEGDEAFDLGGEDGEVARLERELDGPAGGARVAQVGLAREAVELLELLDGVGLDAGPQALLDDGQEVDEQLGAQHAVELAGARGVPAHEPLERGGLVGRVVVDVEPRVGFPERGDFVEDFFEDALLSSSSGVDGPLRDVARLARGPRGSVIPKRYSRGPSTAKWSPSRSRKTSPGEGSGRRARPRPSSMGSSSWMGAWARRPASWMRAWPCAFSSDSFEHLAGLNGMGRTRSPRRSSVLTSFASNSRRLRRVMPATRERWSSAWRRLSQGLRQRQTSQWSTGSG